MTSTTFFFIFIPLLTFILLAINLVFAPHNSYQEKNSVFECGFHSFLGQNRTQFSISFFIFALLFLLFDLEILLVYPYVVSAHSNDIYGLSIYLVFILVLTLGFSYELGKNALKLESRQMFSDVIKKLHAYSLLSGFNIKLFDYSSKINSVVKIKQNKVKTNYFYLYYYLFSLILVILLITIIVLFMQNYMDPIFCIDEEIEKKLLAAKELAKNINPSVSGNTVSVQTESINVNVPSNVLNSLGLGGTILGGMKIGTSVIKGGSPFAKAGFAIAGGIAGGAIHTMYTGMNKFSNYSSNHIIDKSAEKGKDGPFSAASSIIEDGDNLFTIEDVMNILNANLILRAVIFYLFYTLMLFFISILVSDNKTILPFIKRLPLGNIIHSWLLKLFSYLSKSGIIFFLLNWIVLLISHVFIIYFLNWFIFNFDNICNLYAKLKGFDEISNINKLIPSKTFTSENTIDYLNNDVTLQVVIVFLLFLVIYSFMCMVVVNNKLNPEWLKKLPLASYTYLILKKLFNNWDRASLIFLWFIFCFLFISSIISLYYWYWFIQDFDIICYTHMHGKK